MADRKRSQDGHRDTDAILGADGSVSQQGRVGGRLSRQIGTRDELKRAYERPAGKTRVTRATEQEGGDHD